MARAIPETPRALIRWAKEGASKIASGDDEGGDAQQGEEEIPTGTTARNFDWNAREFAGETISILKPSYELNKSNFNVVKY